MLGQPSPRRMLAEMSANELEGWQVFLTMYPRGERLLNLLFANQTASIVNSQRAKGKAAISVEKFMLQMKGRDLRGRKKMMTPGAMLRVAEVLNARWGGRDLRGSHSR